MKAPNNGGCFLQQWNLGCIDKNNNGKKQNVIKSTKTNSLTGDSGATSIPPIGDSSMYIEISSIHHGINVFVSFERIDIIQISK